MKLFRCCHFCLEMHSLSQGRMKLGEPLCTNGMQLAIRKEAGDQKEEGNTVMAKH